MISIKTSAIKYLPLDQQLCDRTLTVLEFLMYKLASNIYPFLDISFKYPIIYCNMILLSEALKI